MTMTKYHVKFRATVAGVFHSSRGGDILGARTTDGPGGHYIWIPLDAKVSPVDNIVDKTFANGTVVRTSYGVYVKHSDRWSYTSDTGAMISHGSDVLVSRGLADGDHHLLYSPDGYDYKEATDGRSTYDVEFTVDLYRPFSATTLNDDQGVDSKLLSGGAFWIPQNSEIEEVPREPLPVGTIITTPGEFGGQAEIYVKHGLAGGRWSYTSLTGAMANGRRSEDRLLELIESGHAQYIVNPEDVEEVYGS